VSRSVGAGAGGGKVVRRGRGRTVGGTNTRVVLAAAPAQTDAGVSNRVSLHLVDGHLGSVAVDKLNETAALARRDLDVGDLAKALEEATELVLGDVAREAADENGGVVGVGELVHLLARRVVGGAISTAVLSRRGNPVESLLVRRQAGSHHLVAVVLLLVRAAVVTSVLGGGRGDAHGAVATVDSLHLNESSLLILLIGETDEAVATRLSRHGIRHDLSRLARGEPRLEEGHKNVFVDLWAEVADEDRVLRTTVVASVVDAAPRSPVELKGTVGVGNGGAVQGEGLAGSLRRGELDEAVSGIARRLVADDLDVDRLSGGGEEDALDEVLIHPGLELAHPESVLIRVLLVRGLHTAGNLSGTIVAGEGHAARDGSTEAVAVGVGRRGTVALSGVVGVDTVHFRD